MEGIQGHINPFLCGELMSLECLEQGGVVDFNSYESCMTSHHHQQMPFLHMLQERGLLMEEHYQQYQPPEPSSFQLLLRLQEQHLLHYQQQQQQESLPGSTHWAVEIDSRPRPPSLELESCLTHASESRPETTQHRHPSPRPDAPCCDREPTAATTSTQKTIGAGVEAERERERMKRKRSRPSSKNVEEVEGQRMTHIAVERNRRKLMNDHLSSLRSLMPPSLIQRGDQASIIGGAIDFVKELEQLLLSLQVEKRMRALRSRSDVGAEEGSSCYTSLGSSSPSTTPLHDFFTSPQYTTYTSSSSSSSASTSSSSSSSPRTVTTKVKEEEVAEGCCSGGSTTRGLVADIEATVIQTHVNLKILSPRRPGQLLRAISVLEELHLAVLHLNITSLDTSVLYSLNLKIEEECKLGSADEIATAVHQIFSYIDGNC